jgi:hypothetical protein
MNVSSPDRSRRVFLVHGRDHGARKALVDLLTAFGLEIINWHDAAAHAGGGAPYTGDIVEAGMELAGAIVVLLTPDDIGYVHPDFREEADGQDERKPTGQARLNVVFEAGMAMARYRKQVVLVEVGRVRKISDIAGVNVIHMDDSIECREDLAGRLQAAELLVDISRNEQWRTAGSFNRPTPIVVDLTSAKGRLTSPQNRSTVTNRQKVTGEVSHLHPRARALILIQSPRDQAYWPQARPLYHDGGFTFEVTFGRSGTFDIGKPYILMLVVATKATSDSFMTFRGKRVPSLPPGMEILDEITVTRG